MATRSTPQDDYCPVLVSKLGAEYSNKHLKFDALLVGVRRGKARIRKATMVCQMCDNSMMIDVEDDRQLPQTCDSCHRRALKIDMEKSILQDFVELRVQELAQNEKHRRVEVKQPHTVVVDADRAPYELAGVISVYGVLVPSLVKGKNPEQAFSFITKADKVEASRDAYADYTPTPDDIEAFKRYFATPTFTEIFRMTNGTIAPHIRGRGLAKVGADFGMHSNLERECNTAHAGDSRTGKTDVMIDLAENLTPPGTDYVACESASRTGIAYSIDYNSSEPELRFGALAACDTAALMLDAVNALHPEEQAQLRETLSQKRIKVNRVLQGEAMARTRVIAGMNLPKDKGVDGFATRAQAAMESFYSTIDRNRYDFVFIYGQRDVEQNEIDEAEKARATNTDASRAIPADIYRKHLAWCWQQHPIQWEDGVFDKLLVKVREIRKRVGLVPLFSNEFTKFAGNWCVAIAQRCHSFEGDKVVVKAEHVQIYADFVNCWLDDLEIEKERKLWEKSEEVDIPRLADEVQLSPNKRGIVLLLAKGAKPNKDICAAMRQDKSLVSQVAGKLKEAGILQSTKEGYSLTQLGLKVADVLLETNQFNGGN